MQEELADGGPYSEAGTLAKLKCTLRAPSNWLCICQGLPGSLPWGVVLTYLNDYLSQQRGFSVQVRFLVGDWTG